MDDQENMNQSHVTEDLHQDLQGEANEAEPNDSQQVDVEGEEGGEEGQYEGEEGGEEGQYEGEEEGQYEEGGDDEEGEEEGPSALGLDNDDSAFEDAEGEGEGEEGAEEMEGEEVEGEENYELGKDFNTYYPEDSKVRYVLLKFINKMRQERGLLPYSIDILGNTIAKEYADYFLEYISAEKKEEKKDPNEFKEELIKKYFMNPEEINFSVFDSAIDGESQANQAYDAFQEEFSDAQATLIEYEEDCKNILSEDFNQVGIGLSKNEKRLVVVNVFTPCKVVIESSSISEEAANLILKGFMNDNKLGVYAIRIVNLEEKPKTIVHITPQFITPSEVDERKYFTAKISQLSGVLEESEGKIIEVYVRERPESIPYNKPFTDKIKFETLTLGCRVPLVSFPGKQQLMDQNKQDAADEEKERKFQQKLEEYNHAKEEERQRRKQAGMGGLGDEVRDAITEVDEEDSASEKENKSEEQKDDIKDVPEELNKFDIIETLDKDIKELEEKNQALAEDDLQIQNKIRIIYELRREKGKEERNFYKESNINESTYADSLSSTAALYNELNEHKKKLDADLVKYKESISEQEAKKQEVYNILIEYKRELLDNAETRKGTKISKIQKEKWLNEEKKYEDQIKDLRIESFTKTLELNRLKKEFKKMEDYFEGLHIIDFEQLKIENNTLTEKIEDRNEEIHKLKGKINTTVQVLAHLQEKSDNVAAQIKEHKTLVEELDGKISKTKDELSKSKKANDGKGLKQLSENQKMDKLNSDDLKNYYYDTLANIESLNDKITLVAAELRKYRKKNKTNDIDDLLKRRDRMMKDFRGLPKKQEDK
ncbi:MAG: DUF4201 domain-containing protein [archaeon]|nr:DUF4201 domain-containing protein [archaeon]